MMKLCSALSITGHIALTVLCVVLLLNSCGKNDSTPAAQQSDEHQTHKHQEQPTVELTDEQIVMAGIELGSVEMRTMSGIIKANGVLDVPPQHMVQVSPRLGGFVKSVSVLEGMFVRKGAVLAVLEHQDFIALQQDFLESKTRLEFAAAEFKRQEELNKEHVNALKTFQQITAEYRSIKSRVAALEQRLRLLGIVPEHVTESSLSSSYAITAAIDGYVGRMNITLGKYVPAGEMLCTLINTAHLHAEVFVFEKDVALLREGQRVRINLVNETQERLGKIYLIGREISSERTARVHVHLEREDRQLLPNTAFTAVVEIGEHLVTTVPESALVNVNGSDALFMRREADEHETAEQKTKEHEAKENKTQEQKTQEQKSTFVVLPVKKGISAGGFVEVQLPESFDRTSKTLVLKGAYSLLSQMSNAAGGGEEHGH